jgi:N-acetyl-anhydromuramyl-L-alanine amidase AmpD
MSVPRDRKWPDVRVRLNVACQSERHGQRPEIIVVHSTEGHNVPGDTDLRGLAEFFNRISTQASSHAATDADGHSSRMVRDHMKAWHVAWFNPVSLGIEQIGFAAQHSWPDKQLRETARWIAYWSRVHGIPIQKGAVSGGQVIRRGVVRHSDLGFIGGGHHDPGPDYPLDRVLEYARHYRARQAAER